MKNIIPIVLVLIAVAGAGFVAKTIRGAPPETDHVEGVTEGGIEDPHGGGGHGKGHAKKKKHGDGHGDGHGGESDIGYYKFARDFIVPVMRGNDVDSLVLLRLSVEMDYNKIEVFRPKEPRIRDAFMQTLLNLSHDGLFSGDITSPDVYETIQHRLIETANGVMDGEAQAVLIVDFARQDQ